MEDLRGPVSFIMETPKKDMAERVREVQDLAREGRSPLAEAFLEDEAVRLASEKRSREYLNRIEEEEDSMKPWMWYLVFFILGMLFDITVTNIGTFIYMGGIAK